MQSSIPRSRTSCRYASRRHGRVLAQLALATLGAVFLLSGLEAAVTSHAAAQQAKKRYAKPHHRKVVRRPARPVERDDGRDFLRDPESLPFGSTVWWRAMDLRQRGGFGGDN